MAHLIQTHAGFRDPSPWVARWEPLVPKIGTVLDLACGGGRHGRLFLARGQAVTFVDKDISALSDLADNPNAEILAEDLETGAPFPLAARMFVGVVVTCYLHRPIFPAILNAVAPGGVLIYETFAIGNEAYGHPARQAYLLEEGELLTRVDARFTIRGYEHGYEDAPKPGVRQRIVAVRKPD